MKARGPEWPWGKAKLPKTPAQPYDIKEWMWGLEGASDWELKQNDETDCRANWWSVHSQWGSQGQRRHRRQKAPRVPREPLGGSPFLGGDSSDRQWMKFAPFNPNKGFSGEWPIRVDRKGIRLKVNLPTFKDEKVKDTVTYCSWHWDVSVFCSSGWDDWHLLPYVFRSLQGFPGDLARSLGKDATLGNVLWMLDKHYGIVMTFDTLSKEFFFASCREWGENVAEFRVCLS